LKILFLTNNINSRPLIDWLIKVQNEDVLTYSQRVNIKFLIEENIEFMISYNYNHIIPPEIVENYPDKIINLHTSYLPWNRGASPNFWSFIYDTPKGVTIHKIDVNIDSGDILFQEEIKFDENIETFTSSYKTLQNKIQELIKKKWIFIKNKQFVPIKNNIKAGSIHYKKDLHKVEEIIGNIQWDMKIIDFKKLYLEKVKKIDFKRISEK